MEFNVKEESKTRIVFELKGETHTFCNALKHALVSTSGVTIATYRISHPLIGIPEFIVETKGIEPRKAIKEALKTLQKQVDEFAKEIKKL